MFFWSIQWNWSSFGSLRGKTEDSDRNMGEEDHGREQLRKLVQKDYYLYSDRLLQRKWTNLQEKYSKIDEDNELSERMMKFVIISTMRVDQISY